MQPIVDVYFAACNRLLGRQWTDASRNITLANSRWTAAGLERLGEVSTPIVLYPPVLDPGEGCRGPSVTTRSSASAISRIRSASRWRWTSSGGRAPLEIRDARLIIVGSAVDHE